MWLFSANTRRRAQIECRSPILAPCGSLIDREVARASVVMPSFGRLSGPIRPHGIEGNDVLHQGAGSPCPPLLFVMMAIRLGRFLVR
jgi:hypothetical protein